MGSKISQTPEMDLYADLPLAKGASSAALDANGNVKTSASSGTNVACRESYGCVCVM
jgi:hypothetical protein